MTRSSRPALVLVLAACCALASINRLAAHPAVFGQSGGQESQGGAKDNFRIIMNVDLVTMDAVVRDRSNAYMGKLAAESFSIYDNGVKQSLSHFSQGQEPLAIALVIDGSPSVKSWLAYLKQAALSALELLKPDDKVVLFAFDQCPTQLTDLTSDHQQIIQGIERVRVGPQTNYYEAVLVAARLLNARAPGYRRAILVISDNYSARFQITEQEVLRELQDDSITLLGIKTPGENKRTAISPDAIERLAKETGGEILILDEEQRMAATLEDAIANLKNRYHLVFSPANAESDLSFHRLEIKLEPQKSCPGCRVLARKGYFAGFRRADAGNGVAGGITSSYACSGGLPEAYVKSTMSAAAHLAEQSEDVAFKVHTTSSRQPGGGPKIQIDFQIDPANVRFNRIDERFTAGLRLLFQWYDARQMMGEEWKTIDLRLDPDAHRELLGSKIPFSLTIQPKAVPQTIRAVVFDSGSNEYGSQVLRMAGDPREEIEIQLLPAAARSQIRVPKHTADSAQPQRAPAPTIKVDVNQVLVPVVVTDATGRPVTGLASGDFRVFEDGVEQQVSALSAERDGGERSIPEPPASGNGISTPPNGGPQSAGKSPNRTCLIVIDTLNSDYGNISVMRGALKKLFREDKSGSVQYGLVTLGLGVKVIQSWTTDSAALLRTVEGKAFARTVQTGVSSNSSSQEVRLERMLQEYCQNRTCPSGREPSPRSPELQLISSFATSSAEMRSAKMKVYLRLLRTLVESLGEMPGKHTLVLLSDGFAVQPGRDLFDLIGMYVGKSKMFYSPAAALDAEMRTVLRSAQQCNTAFYTINSRQIYVTADSDDVNQRFPIVASARSQKYQHNETLTVKKDDGMRELASQTGGLFFSNSNDISGSLRRAVEDGRVSYLLSYLPSNTEAGGKFRQIKVEVRGKQLTVRSKSGYWAPAK